MLWNCCAQHASKFGNSSVARGLEKVSFNSNPKWKALLKNAQTTIQLLSSHTLVKQCSKFSKPGSNSMWTVNFQMFKLKLENAKEWEIKFQYLLDHRKSKRVSGKHLLLLYWLCQTLLTAWITKNSAKFWKRWEYQTAWPASWESVCRSGRTDRTGHGTADWFHIEKGVHQGCILSPCLFN